jgi:ketosteroid isomerase-like protein
MSNDGIEKFVDTFGLAFRSHDPLVSGRALERDNLAVLHRVYAAVATRDFDAIAPDLADDVELEIVGPAVVPFIGKWRGIPAVLGAIQRNFSFVKNQRPEIVNLTAQGNSIVVVAREQGESATTGKPYDIHWVQIFTFRDGKLCRIHEVADGLDLALAFAEVQR